MDFDLQIWDQIWLQRCMRKPLESIRFYTFTRTVILPQQKQNWKKKDLKEGKKKAKSQTHMDLNYMSVIPIS